MRVLALNIILCLTASLSVNAQVVLSGSIMNGGEGLDDVTIRVTEDGKMLRTIAASKRGKYEIDVPFGHTYILTFTRPYMVPVSVQVNTDVEAGGEDESYMVPLNMEMFNRYKGMDRTTDLDPIGVITQTGTGEETFSFVADTEMIGLFKSLQKESQEFERKGESPVLEEVQSTQEKENEVFHEGEADHIDNLKLSSENETKPATEVKSEDTIIDREGRQNKRYEMIDEANEISTIGARSRIEGRTSSKEESAEVNSMHTAKQKKTRAAYHEERQAQQRELADARVARDAEIFDAITSGAAGRGPYPDMDDSQPIVIKVSESSGWFYDEEIIVVRRNHDVEEYRKTTYNWVLFDATYYYLNETEISATDFQEINRLAQP